MRDEDRNLVAAREWLARARGNLVLATQAKPTGAFWEDLCFNAQQAAEKALKAVLVCRGIEFPRTHDLEELMDLLERTGLPPPQDRRKAMALTQYAVEARYPFPETGEEITEADHQEAVTAAGAIVDWADNIIEGK